MNQRLRSTINASDLDEQALAEKLGVDRKTVQRWVTTGRTPHPRTAFQAARLLGVPATWLWEDLDRGGMATSAEVVAFYPHRSEVPRSLWLNLLQAAQEEIWIMAYASLFLPEENLTTVEVLRRKAEAGLRVCIALGDPDSPEVALRGAEEQLFQAIAGRVRMALAYYRPLLGAPGVEFHLHRTTLYNSIFRFDDEMLVNQHVYGAYGYVAPILHLRRVPGGDLFETYARSFERIWRMSCPFEPVQTGQGSSSADDQLSPEIQCRDCIERQGWH
jgi:transcriptional regulator with XRE-family HTH domain